MFLYYPCVIHYRWNQSMMVTQPVWGFENLDIIPSFSFPSPFTWILQLIELVSQTFKNQGSIDACCVCAVLLHLPGGATRFESGSRKKKVRGGERPLRNVPNWLLSLFGGHCGLVLPKLLHPFGCQISSSLNIRCWFLWSWEFFVVPGLCFFYYIKIIFYLLYKAFVRITFSMVDSVFSTPVT